MRVLIHGINYSPEVISTGKYTGEMGEWLATRGHEVRVVTSPPYYPAWRVSDGYSSRRYRRESVSSVDVRRCPLWVPSRPSGAKRLLHLASFAASSLPMMLMQIAWRPDIVITVEPSLLCAPQAWLTARLSGAKVWLHVQDFELDAAMGLGMLEVTGLEPVLLKAEAYIMRKMDRVSTITEPMRLRVVQKGVREHRARLVPNWADIEFVRPMRPDERMRQELGARPEDVLVLYAGNMGEKQGLELVLGAAEKLRWRSEIRFAMVGAGTARERLERLASERGLGNMRFFPVQPWERLPTMLAAGDIHLVVQRRVAADLVMPSKLTNILAAGRPCVATTEKGTALWEVLDGHRCGIPTAPDNVVELAEGIDRLAVDAGMRARLGENARRYAESYLDKEEILGRFEVELREVVKAGT